MQTTCSYCGVGCQLVLEVKDNQIVKVDSAWDGPANHGWTCVKGRFGYDYVQHPDRLTQPRVRKYLLEGTPRPEGRGELGGGGLGHSARHHCPQAARRPRPVMAPIQWVC